MTTANTETTNRAAFDAHIRMNEASYASSRARAVAHTVDISNAEAAAAAKKLSDAISRLENVTDDDRAKVGYIDYLKSEIASAARHAAGRSNQAAIDNELLRQMQAQVAMAIAATVEDTETAALVEQENRRTGAVR